MVRVAKKEAAAKAEAVVELVPPSGEAEDIKKSGGRGKRKVKEPSTENSPPKRTLRSNSKSTLPLIPVAETEVVTDEKKGARKAPAKTKKATNGQANGPSEKTDALTNGSNGVPESKTENGQADVPVDKPAEKAGKGKKTKTEPKTEVAKATEEKAEEAKGSKEETAAANGASEKDKKPVKATKGKKKGESQPIQPETEASTEPEAKTSNGNVEEELKEKEKAASGKGKKKAEKPKEEEVAAKKSKKEAPAKPGKTAKNADSEDQKQEKESKPAATETKKVTGKGKGAKAKEVAIEHCKS